MSSSRALLVKLRKLSLGSDPFLRAIVAIATEPGSDSSLKTPGWCGASGAVVGGGCGGAVREAIEPNKLKVKTYTLICFETTHGVTYPGFLGLIWSVWVYEEPPAWA